MSIDLAEKLKRDLTDKYVVVADKVPELRRFVGLTGTVKTVNMSGRALVQFDGPVDIGWYDIDPSYLKVVDAPVKKAEPAAHAKAPAAEKPAAKPAAAAPVAKGKSPLELAREQAAAKAGGAAPAAAAAAAPAKKLSPLELARQQGAKKAGDAAPAAPAVSVAEAAPAAAESAPAAEAPAPAQKPAAAPPTGPGGKKLSPLELARMQGAAKKKE